MACEHADAKVTGGAPQSGANSSMSCGSESRRRCRSRCCESMKPAPKPQKLCISTLKRQLVMTVVARGGAATAETGLVLDAGYAVSSSKNAQTLHEVAKHRPVIPCAARHL